MTADGFRRLALAMPGAIEGSHHGHADFRRGKLVFATLGQPDHGFAMVALRPEQQEEMCAALPLAAWPVPGAWGRRGSTSLRLADAGEDLVADLVTMAFEYARERSGR